MPLSQFMKKCLHFSWYCAKQTSVLSQGCDLELSHLVCLFFISFFSTPPPILYPFTPHFPQGAGLIFHHLSCRNVWAADTVVRCSEAMFSDVCKCVWVQCVCQGGTMGLSEVSWCFISLLWLPLYDLAVICTGTLTGISRCSTTVLMMVPDNLIWLCNMKLGIECQYQNDQLVILHLCLIWLSLLRSSAICYCIMYTKTFSLLYKLSCSDVFFHCIFCKSFSTNI